MADMESSVSVNVTGLEEPIREINAAVENVASTIKTNRRISLYITLLTLVNLVVVGLTSWAEQNAVYIVAFVIGALVLSLFFTRRRPVNKE